MQFMNDLQSVLSVQSASGAVSLSVSALPDTSVTILIKVAVKLALEALDVILSTQGNLSAVASITTVHYDLHSVGQV